MALWDFFHKKKEETKEQNADKMENLPSLGEAERKGAMVWETEEAEDADIETAFVEDSLSSVQACCERIMEAAGQMEEARAEYSAVTSYLSDMQKIERISREEREDLETAARDIITLTREREEYRGEDIRLSPAVRQTMQKYQKEMVGEIKKMYDNEAYQRAIKNDLKYLEGEKGYLKYQRQEIVSKQKYLRNIAVTTSILVVVLFALIYALAKVFRADMRLPFILTIAMAAISAAYIYFEANKNRSHMLLTEKKLSKAVGLLNKVKIKYVNNTSCLEYTYEKFGVSSAMELEHQWQQYEEMRQRERQIRSNTDKLNANNEKLIALLEKYEIADPDIWIHQPAAILDKKEMVEIRHRLNVRRQRLRDRIDYNNKVKQESAAKMQQLLLQQPELREEVVALLQKYQIEV